MSLFANLLEGGDHNSEIPDTWLGEGNERATERAAPTVKTYVF
jgi:hypothetical protein